MGNNEDIGNSLINREISWLHFNDRVLQEAIDKSTPLLERVKFLGIYSNNRDEFFRVRVATLNRVIKIDKESDKAIKSQRVLSEIDEMVAEQEKTFTRTYLGLMEELAGNDIVLVNEQQLSDDQGKYIYGFYRDKIRPILFPLMLDNVKDLDSLQDASIFLAIHLLDSRRKDVENFAIIKVPSDELDRIIVLPSDGKKQYFMYLDDVIRHCLSDIFSFLKFDIFNAYTIKFTRDSELDIDNDVSRSFLEKLQESVKKRRRGEPVRFVYDDNIPEEFLKKITKKLGITKHDKLRGGGRYHNFKDFMDFPDMGKPEFKYPRATPMRHKALIESKSIFDVLKKQDIMLHYPYQSFQHLIDILREASIDPDVRSIKMTFYRAARHSAALNALINAARNGKYVTVYMEIQARFDEEANIYWTQRLQEEGAKVIQSIPGYKVHAKLILIRRREEGINHFYANITTGNFNESTARVYADESLFTANEEICQDVYNLFELMESKFIFPTFKKLIVAPFAIRDFFAAMLDNEMANAREGKEAWAIIKLNSLVDKKIARKLYEASNAGVRINLIARGLCVIKPGVMGLSENINAISIVDKFLEHSRIYIFCNGGDHAYYIASADWMQRNFDHRIEVVCPIEDKDIRKELWDMVQIQLSDNTKARLLIPDRLNHYKRDSSTIKRRSQFEIYDYFKKKLDS